MKIKQITFGEIEAAPNFDALFAEYTGESAIEGMPVPAAKMELYKQLESTGAIHIIGAYLDETLIGFIVVLTSVLPHYSALAATTESFFVAKEHRHTGAGLKLLREAERHAKDCKACGLLISAPIGGSLAAVLEKTDYRETNRVFFKRIE